MATKRNLPVAVIGAGPVGLAAAAHLIERGEIPIIFEAGAEVGANVRDWQHVRMFSPWEFTVDSASVRLLERHGWQMPPRDEMPTGKALIEQYMQPLAALPEIAPHLHLKARVVAVSRRDLDKMKDAGREHASFVLHITYGDGDEAIIEARAVIDASGTWQQPNPLGSGGLPAIGEKRTAQHIRYGIPDILDTDRERYTNKRVMVVGSGHSAINALLELVELQKDAENTRIYWAMRTTNLAKVLGGGENDALPARGELGLRLQPSLDNGSLTLVAPFHVQQLEQQADGIRVSSGTPDGVQTVEVDEIIATTGARPDLDILRELRLDLDPSLECTRQLGPMIDPNIHSCGTVPPHGEAELRHPEKDFYIVGMKSYGRAPTFLLATGYEQVRSVVAGLVGDWESARDVQLNLPETGVCHTDFAEVDGGCCAPSAVVESGAIALDAIGTIPVLNAVQLKTTDRNMDDCCS